MGPVGEPARGPEFLRPKCHPGERKRRRICHPEDRFTEMCEKLRRSRRRWIAPPAEPALFRVKSVLRSRERCGIHMYGTRRKPSLCLQGGARPKSLWTGRKTRIILAAWMKQEPTVVASIWTPSRNPLSSGRGGGQRDRERWAVPGQLVRLHWRCRPGRRSIRPALRLSRGFFESQTDSLRELCDRCLGRTQMEKAHLHKRNP